VLTAFEGFTQEALANRLGISRSAAKSRVQRGREQLKEMLLDYCEREFSHARPAFHPYSAPIALGRPTLESRMTGRKTPARPSWRPLAKANSFSGNLLPRSDPGKQAGVLRRLSRRGQQGGSAAADRSEADQSIAVCGVATGAPLLGAHSEKKRYDRLGSRFPVSLPLDPPLERQRETDCHHPMPTRQNAAVAGEYVDQAGRPLDSLCLAKSDTLWQTT
jgi:hypothetical protein